MIEAYRPALDEMDFRERLLADEATMAYNAAWGGAIAFPREKWAGWYRRWLEVPETERYYRYLRDAETGRFVGEIAYRFEGEKGIYICNVIVMAQYRGRGYGTRGIALLCKAAKANGVAALWDDIAADNPSVKLFLENGFSVAYRDESAVMVRKVL
ncbi:MAG: GNAT family N-acetyltransferase [Clostridia bacterium]|nr:GNAT family N-acetyltransferase [Clostridia bacterium]